MQTPGRDAQFVQLAGQPALLIVDVMLLLWSIV
jgi:hypothetical protein